MRIAEKRSLSEFFFPGKNSASRDGMTVGDWRAELRTHPIGKMVEYASIPSNWHLDDLHSPPIASTFLKGTGVDDLHLTTIIVLFLQE